MNKLQEGDFVANLDEYQFEELMKICDDNWIHEDDCIVVYIDESIRLAGYNPIAINNRLTFDEFKDRAINTFKNN